MPHDPFEGLSRELADDFRPRRRKRRRRKRPLRDQAAGPAKVIPAATRPAQPPAAPAVPKKTPTEIALARASERTYELDEIANRAHRAITPSPSETEYKYMIQPLTSSQDVFATAGLEALASRMGGPAPRTPAGRELAGSSVKDLAAEALRLAGRRAVGTDEDVLAAAFAMDAMTGPGSFPSLLSSAVKLVLDSTEDYAPPTYTAWARKVGPVPDFKPHTLWSATGITELPQHIDGQPYEQSTFLESVGSVAVDEYGDEFVLTPRMAVDDTLGGFGEALKAKREAHDATLNSLCVSLLVNNPAAADGVNLFDASRGNVRSPGAAISETELSEVRKLFRAMVDPNGRTLGKTVGRVLVPSALETTCEKVLADLQVVPASTSDAEVFRKRIGWDTEPGLDADSATKWYAFAKGGRAAVVYAHQVGYETCQVRRYLDNRTQSLCFQFTGRFAAAVLNPQGVCRNDGGG